MGNVGGEAERCCREVRLETRRCVKMRLRPDSAPEPPGELTALPQTPRGRGIGNGEWTEPGRERERKGKEREKRGEGKWEMKIVGGVCAIGFRGIDAP